MKKIFLSHFNSRSRILKITYRMMCVILLLGLPWQGCKKGDDVSPNGGIELKTADEISKVLVIPDAELIKGSPPSPTSNSSVVELSNETPEISGISGVEMPITLRYKYNTNKQEDKLEYVYLQFEESSYCFKIPIETIGQSGVIHIPITIPANYSIPHDGSYKKRGYCMKRVGMTYGGKCIEYGDPSCISNVVLPPRAGKGNATINGKSYSANALCDYDIPGFGNAFGIVIGESDVVFVYNLKQGANQLKDPLRDDDVMYAAPWGGVISNGNMYFSVSGSATYKGKVVSVSGTFRDVDGRNITVSASGNCE